MKYLGTTIASKTEIEDHYLPHRVLLNEDRARFAEMLASLPEITATGFTARANDGSVSTSEEMPANEMLLSISCRHQDAGFTILFPDCGEVVVRHARSDRRNYESILGLAETVAHTR